MCCVFAALGGLCAGHWLTARRYKYILRNLGLDLARTQGAMLNSRMENIQLRRALDSYYQRELAEIRECVVDFDQMEDDLDTHGEHWSK